MLHDLLLRLYAFGPAPIAYSRDWRRDWRVAQYALRRGLVELADGAPLETSPCRVFRQVRITALGRGRLGLPSAFEADRPPFDVLADAVRRFLRPTVEVRIDPTGELLCCMESWNDVPGWEPRVHAITRFASEHGVWCAPVIDNPRGDRRFVLQGFVHEEGGSHDGG